METGCTLQRTGWAPARADTDPAPDLILACAAHELKGPLMGVAATLEQLLDPRTDEADYQRMLQRSSDELRRAGRIIDLLLLPPQAQPVRPTDLAGVAASALASVVDPEHDGRVTFRGDAGVIIPGNGPLLTHAIGNVIRNALWYTPAARHVTVAVTGGASFAAVTVADEGPGIAADELPHIFDPWMRGRTTAEGSGLGLFMTRRIVEAHDGHIHVWTAASGTTFALHLPTDRNGEHDPRSDR